jgi:hypothetical protein
MSTYSVFVDGYSFEHGLSKTFAESLIELLKDHFPGANCTAIKEK